MNKTIEIVSGFAFSYKDELVHLLEVLKCYLMSISKLLAQSEVMSDDE